MLSRIDSYARSDKLSIAWDRRPKINRSAMILLQTDPLPKPQERRRTGQPVFIQNCHINRLSIPELLRISEGGKYCSIVGIEFHAAHYLERHRAKRRRARRVTTG
jgi:hypothetical protein